MKTYTTIFWSGISIFGHSGISFLSTIILARMLTPDDFGLIGIVTIFMLFSQMMVDSEMGGALLKKREVSVADYSTLFYYNLAISVGLYVLFYFTSPLIADFYGRNELVDIIRILSVTIIIHAFRVVQKIMIFRDLNFKLYALINTISGLISLGVAIWMAQARYGYWALVWQQIVLAVCHVACMQAYNRFVPSLSFSKESFRYQFSFGISLLGADAMRTIANNISTNIIGKISSLQFTGYYTQVSRITNFCQSFLGIMMDQTIFPMFVKLENTEKLSAIYHRLLKKLIVALILMTILLVSFSIPIVRIILGEEWVEASYLFKILSLTILPTSIQVLCRNIIKTLGKTKHVLILESIKSIIVIMLLLSSSLIGNIWVVWALVTAQYITTALWLVSTEKQLKNNIGTSLMQP